MFVDQVCFYFTKHFLFYFEMESFRSFQTRLTSTLVCFLPMGLSGSIPDCFELHSSLSIVDVHLLLSQFVLSCASFRSLTKSYSVIGLFGLS